VKRKMSDFWIWKYCSKTYSMMKPEWNTIKWGIWLYLDHNGRYPGHDFPWTSCRTDDVLISSVGSTSLSTSIWRQHLYASLVMDRDIFRCQKMQKVASGVVLHIDSYNLHGIGFGDEHELESLFYSWSFVVSFASYGRLFPGMYIHWIDSCEYFKVLDYFVDGMNENCGKSTPQQSTIL
jgi:hypothetical protein